MIKDYEKLFLENNKIVIYDTETTGLYKKENNEITSPEITQF